MVAGTKGGYIVAEAPWWKTTYFEVHYENAEKIEKYSEIFWAMDCDMRSVTFISMINGSNNSEFKLTRGESVAMAEIMEEYLREEGRG